VFDFLRAVDVAMLPRVVIVGGGFGGLSAARALRNAPVSVTLIDKRNYHLFRPMLYQVATGLLSADEISGPLRSIFSHQKNVDVLLDEVTGINSDLVIERFVFGVGERAERTPPALAGPIRRCEDREQERTRQ